MKKRLLTLVFACLLITSAVQAQKSLYTQAVNLLNSKSAYSDTAIMITPAMAGDLANIFAGDRTALIAALNEDPYFKGYYHFHAAAASGYAAVHSGFAAVGSLDVTNFANAIASLMIDRAKQELTLAFFDKLETFSKKYPEFQTLFPQTYDKLRNLLSYNYPQMLPALRDAFFADLQKVTFNLEAVLELPKYKTLMENFPEINMAVQTLKLVHKLEGGESPDKVIADVDDAVTSITGNAKLMANASLAFKNTVTTVHFARMLSDGLRDATAGAIWITAAQAGNLIKDEPTTRFFLGMLWLQAGKDAGLQYYFDPKNPATGTSLQSLLGDNKDNILLFQNKISGFVDQAGKVQEAYNAISTANAAGNKPTQDQYYNFINTSLDLVDFSLSAVKMIDDRLQPDDYLAVARKSNSLYKDIYSKQYTQAVSDGLDIISSIEKLTKYDKSRTVATSAAKGALDYKSSSEALSTFADKVKPVALFIANVAEAKTEADIKAALNNAILPVGSSSIKKNTLNNLSVQTYLGAYFTSYNYTPDAVRAWSDKFGVYGPVGLAYTPGITSWGKYGSLSLFASVFDLGAIIDYKLKQDPSTTTSTNPSTASTSTKSYSVNLDQIFSPGVHLVYGLFSNIPLSLGFGAQYGPGLSKIDAAGTTSVINPSWRWNAFLAVDLPFFNLINKSKPGK